MASPLRKVARLFAGCVVVAGASVSLVAAADASAPGHGFSGYAFDACSAPSVGALRAWSVSPFKGLNIYIGGGNRACTQPHLNAGWVRTVTAMGWHLIPTYVSLQAPYNSCRCHSIVPKWANSEGVAAADNAVQAAVRLGIGRGNPIYDDMEAYVPGPTNRKAVASFLQGWTGRLHGLGYRSGVYSSAESGLANLVSRVGTSFSEPNDIWIADWNGRDTTKDPYVPSADWSHHQRIHQYRGAHDEDYGGVTLNVDISHCAADAVSAGTLNSPRR